jgi:hypothetical protein
VWIAFIAVSVLVLMGTAAFIIERSQQNATTLARQDCARQIGAEQAKVRDLGSTTARAVSRYYFKAALDAQVNHLPVTETQLEEFTALIRAADHADDSQLALPDLAHEVDRRCPS